MDGLLNLKILVDVLGREPELPHRQAPFKCARRFFIRRNDDALPRRVPDEADEGRLLEAVPGIRVRVHAREGMRLSGLPDQASHGFGVADLRIGADDEDELVEKHHAAGMLDLGLAT